jgi:rod shape-determining protein MreB
MGGVVASNSIRVAGDEIDEAIVEHVRYEYNLLIGDRTAEQIKIEIGSACPVGKEELMTVRGRDLMTGLPKSVKVTSSEIRRAIEKPVGAIADAVRITLEKTPPELAADIMERGIALAGGGALLRGIERRIERETGIPVHLVEDPLSCVVLGTGKALEEIDILRKVVDGTGD